MDDFKVGQLTKELVAIQLKRKEDPCAVAADIVHRTLRVAIRAIPPGDAGRGLVIEEAIYGGMQAMVLGDHDLSRGSVFLLEGVADLASEFGLDPTEALRSALCGLARLRRLLTVEQLDDLRFAIGERFLGAAEVYAELLEAQPDPGARSLNLAKMP